MNGPPADPSDAHRRAIADIISAHFAAAHQRVDPLYREHFRSAATVFDRHWTCRRDLAHDLATAPRSLWLLIRAALTRRRPRAGPLSRKDRMIQRLLIDELLQPDALAAMLQSYCQPHVEVLNLAIDEAGARCDAAAADMAAMAQRQLEDVNMPTGGTRELLLFVVTGLIGRGFTDKVVFGSALGSGGAVATGLYLGQQGWWDSLWIKLFGVPGWVPVAGMLGGLAALLIATALLTPLIELGINRLRARKMMHRLIHRVEHQLLDERPDAVNIAGRLATLISLLPDLAQLVRTIR